MNLGLCIVNLLGRYPAVKVPGIGVFKITRVPASYDDKQLAFIPPSSRIELMEEAPDFFSITTYVQSQKQVDEHTANLMLEKVVSELLDSISRNGQVLLDGLGYLLADGASFVFKPLVVEGLGWKAIEAPSPIVVPSAKSKDLAGTPEGLLAEQTFEPARDSEVNQQKGRTRGWIVAALLVAVLFATGLFLYYGAGPSSRAMIDGFFGDTDSQQGVGKEPVEEAVLADTPGDLAIRDTVVADSVSVASVSVDSPTVAVEKVVRPSVTYEIIVGSFATMAQANKYVATMKSKGYDVYAIESKMPGNRKKISWGSYATEEEAYQELSRVQKNFEPGAWIAKIEHDK